MATANWGSLDLGGTIGLLQAGARLRVAHWPGAAGGPGTVVLAQGRAEFIELYGEMIEALRQRGFAVVAFDFRGQGGSQRVTRGGHVGSYREYQDDLAAVVRYARQIGLPRPLHVLAHSMGGLVALGAQPTLAREVERMVLAAPLLGIERLPATPALVGGLATVACACGLSRRALSGRREARPVFANNRLTSDRRRFETLCALVEANAGLVTGPPTLGWLRATLAAMRRLHRDAGRPLPVPTLFVASGADSIVSTEAIDRFARAAPGGGMILVPGARHQLLFEREELRRLFFAAFDAFLDAPPRLAPAAPRRLVRPLRFRPAERAAPASADAAPAPRADGRGAAPPPADHGTDDGGRRRPSLRTRLRGAGAGAMRGDALAANAGRGEPVADTPGSAERPPEASPPPGPRRARVLTAPARRRGEGRRPPRLG